MPSSTHVRCGSATSSIFATGAVAQASTNSAVNVAGAEVDARPWRSLSYTVAVAANAVTWSVWGANAADYSDEVQVQAPASVASGANSSYSIAQALFAYYRVKILDAVGGTHGTATVSGIAKP